MDQELICRTCFTKTTRCLSVFTEPKLWDKVVSVYRMIMACAPVEISADDGLPSKICETCLTKLQYSFLFRVQILQADIKLRNYSRKIEDSLPEPILTDTKSNMQQIYTLDQILQSESQLHNALNSSDNKLFNQSSIKIELKSEPVNNETVEFREEVIPDEDMIPLKTDNEICSVDSNEEPVEEVNFFREEVIVIPDEDMIPLKSDNQICSVDSKEEPVEEVNFFREEVLVILDEDMVPLKSDNQICSVDSNEVPAEEVNFFGEEVIVIPDEDEVPLNTDNQICSVDLNEVLVEEVNFEANTVFCNENNHSNSPLRNKTVTNSENLHTKVVTLNDNNEIQNEYTSQISSGDLIMTCIETGVFNNVQNILTSDVLSTESCNSSNLTSVTSPLNNTAQSIPINNIAEGKIDQNKTISSIVKSLKTNMDSKHETKSSLTNHTCTKIDKNIPLQVQTIANTDPLTANILPSQEKKLIALVEPYKNLTNSRNVQNIPVNNNTVLTVNQSKEIQNKQKTNKNSDDLKDSQNSHLSKIINFNLKLAPIPSYVLGEPCTTASKNEINPSLTSLDSKVKFYKFPINRSLHEPTVVNSRKPSNDAIVPNKPNQKNVKCKIVSVQSRNITLPNKIVTRSKSTNSILSQTLAASSSLQKNTMKYLPQQYYNCYHVKRQAAVKVYVNKRKKGNSSLSENVN